MGDETKMGHRQVPVNYSVLDYKGTKANSNLAGLMRDMVNSSEKPTPSPPVPCPQRRMLSKTGSNVSDPRVRAFSRYSA